MGGQACILYGAAEFSRDVGLAVAADEKNLTRLRHALAELRAEPVFVPALSPEVLLQGHACHFRLNAADNSNFPALGRLMSLVFATSCKQRKRSATRIGRWCAGW
jgi:hypothetical protein